MDKNFYARLHNEQVESWRALQVLRDLLNEVETVRDITSFKDLEKFVTQRHEDTLEQFSRYVKMRQDGSPRLMFTDILHAKWYLVQISPTKIVDGVWLKGVQPLTNNDNVEIENIKNILTNIYLEECGMMSGSKKLLIGNGNHIEIYRKLLNQMFQYPVNDISGIINHPFLDNNRDDLFVTGCIQQCLALCTKELLPEIIGYNLCYEQIALHLMITDYELKELGIDSTYFNLHLTIDNFHCGHAREALHAAKDLLTFSKNPANDLDRIMKGFQLSNLGVDGMKLANDYKLENVIAQLMEGKGRVSWSLHANILGLEDILKTGTGKDILHYLENNGYFSSSTLENTKFYEMLQKTMVGTFTVDELDYIRAYLLKRLGEKSMNKIPDSKIDICNLIQRAINKHDKILMTHPYTGETDTMKNWFQRDQNDFLLCISSPHMKQRTLDSFLEGRMRNVRMSEDEKRNLFHWLRS